MNEKTVTSLVKQAREHMLMVVWNDRVYFGVFVAFVGITGPDYKITLQYGSKFFTCKICEIEKIRILSPLNAAEVIMNYIQPTYDQLQNCSCN